MATKKTTVEPDPATAPALATTPELLPTQGGCYTRNPDGSLTLDAPAVTDQTTQEQAA
jgi:hypothetical protein